MKDRTSVFFTSDWHIGHAKVLEYSKRPFKDLDEMHDALVRRFNATVPPGSIVYFLGDMGMCKPELIKSVLDKLNPCTKILVLGNHDGSPDRMLKCGFNLAIYSTTLYVANERVTLSHCPLLGVKREDTSMYTDKNKDLNWHGEHKNHRFTVRDEGQFHLSGHIHSGPNNPKAKTKQGRQWDIGVDANGYKPVSLSQVESWIALTLKSEHEAKQS